MRNPFIPSQSRVCDMANLVMVFTVVVAGLVAASASFVMQVMQ